MEKKKILNVKVNEITILHQTEADFISCFNYGEINNRMGDQSNINAFKNYGKDGLQNNRSIDVLLSQQRDRAYNDIANQAFTTQMMNVLNQRTGN